MREYYLFLVLLISMLPSSAQMVSSGGCNKGLVSDKGFTILENKYCEVELIDKTHKVYIYRDQSHAGLYFFENGFRLLCEYDEIKLVNDIYMLRIGNKYGWLIPAHARMNIDMPVMIELQFDYAKPVTRQLIIVQKAGQYAAVNLNEFKSNDTLTYYDHRIDYTLEKGLYYQTGGDTTMLLRQMEGSADLTPVMIPSEKFWLDEYFAWYWSRSDGRRINHNDVFDYSLTGSLPDVFNLVSLTKSNDIKIYKCTKEPKVDYTYFDSWKSILREEVIGRQTKTTLIDPFTGKVFYEVMLKKNEELRMDGYVVDRDLDDRTELYIYSSIGSKFKSVFVGSLVGYDYQAYQEPRIETGTYSGSSGKKPFFMPGKD